MTSNTQDVPPSESEIRKLSANNLVRYILATTNGAICPMCKTNSWTVGTGTDGNVLLIAPSVVVDNNAVFSGQVMPMAHTQCKKCGFLAFFPSNHVLKWIDEHAE